MKVLRLTFVLILLDQATKLWVKGVTLFGHHIGGIPMAEPINVIGQFFRITYVENPGMAFSIDFGATTKIFFSIFSLLAGVGILAYLHTMRNAPRVTRFALAMILAGAIGNFIDRAFYGVFYGTGAFLHGSVVDFLDVDFFKVDILNYHLHRWPVFNVADSCVSVGIVLLVITFQSAVKTSGVTAPETPAPPDIAETHETGSGESNTGENPIIAEPHKSEPPAEPLSLQPLADTRPPAIPDAH